MQAPDFLSSPEQMPRHVAIIPDGNRRWAREHGKNPWEGHEEGAKRIEDIVREARRLFVREVSFWGSSLENLAKRSLQERKELLRIYEKYFEKLMSEKQIYEDEVRIRCIGRWQEQFPDRLKKILEHGIEATKQYSKYFLNFFLAYSGDDDMLQAVRHISGEGLAPGMVTETELKKHLMTAEVPPVDLLVRTGRDPHLSAGFMMWETKDAQLAFPDCYFPDFGKEAFQQVLREYVIRERRFGG